MTIELNAGDIDLLIKAVGALVLQTETATAVEGSATTREVLIDTASQLKHLRNGLLLATEVVIQC